MAKPTDTNAIIHTGDDPAVVRLRELHEQTIRATASAIGYAIEAGEILARIRATFPKRAPKGAGFGDWVEQNLPYSKRYAFAYVKAYNERARWLSNPDATLRQLLGVKTPTNSTDDNDGDDPTDNPENEVFELSTSQEKRAEQIANYFGVSKQRARLFVRDTRPKPRQPKTDANADPENQLAKRTIRVPNDTDDLITRVARTTNRSYAVVANELFEVGRRVFVRRYDLNE